MQKYFAPIIIREIHALLLLSPFGGTIRNLQSYGTRTNQIAAAIDILQDSYKEDTSIEELANQVNMSPASFNRHFKRLLSNKFR